MITLDPNDTTALRLLANATDAARCVAIIRSGMAAIRPVSAWQLLPLGYSPARTVLMLEGMEVEAGPLAEQYRHYRDVLEKRSAIATAAWMQYLNGADHARYENHTAH